MIFFKSLIPIELWLIIYKIEHNNKLLSVNNEIKRYF